MGTSFLYCSSFTRNARDFAMCNVIWTWKNPKFRLLNNVSNELLGNNYLGKQIGKNEHWTFMILNTEVELSFNKAIQTKTCFQPKSLDKI